MLLARPKALSFRPRPCPECQDSLLQAGSLRQEVTQGILAVALPEAILEAIQVEAAVRKEEVPLSDPLPLLAEVQVVTQVGTQVGTLEGTPVETLEATLEGIQVVIQVVTQEETQEAILEGILEEEEAVDLLLTLALVLNPFKEVTQRGPITCGNTSSITSSNFRTYPCGMGKARRPSSTSPRWPNSLVWAT